MPGGSDAPKGRHHRAGPRSMSLRLIQVTVPGGHEIEDLLEEYPVTAVWEDSRQSADGSEPGPTHIVQFAVPAEATEAIMDRLEERLGSVEGFRLALLSVEALLPREVPRDSSGDSESSEASKPQSAEGEAARRDRISREELYSDITEGLGPTPVFLAMAGLSAAVAALGLLRDDLAVVIGAMVIAPLLQPNVALALAATLGDIGLAWRALKAIVSGAFLALVLAVVAGLLLPVDPSVPTLAARSSLDLGALAMAAAAGAAGALAFTRGLAGPVIGVMVAVALLPPLVAFGVLAGAGQWRPAFGALLLCLGNTICINLAGIATFLLQGIRPRTWWEKERARRATLVAAVIWAVLLVSLVILLAVIEPPAAMAAEWTEPEASLPSALPGALPLAPELAARVTAAGREEWATSGTRGVRSEHLRPDGSPLYVNRLILEDSPYLRQHAHNPVDWRPFGPEAFETARRTGKPIFLSIGYSTCHWCHVMERESFENLEVAERLNRDFVPVKVDREQRPEVDEVYMTALLVMSGSGGWPLSAFLTPEGQPFLAGTYFPRERFLELLDETASAWGSRRPKLEARAAKVVEAVARVHGALERATEVGEETIAAAIRQSLAAHDSRRGGFSPAPKFPHEAQLLLLLRQALRLGRGPSQADALAAVEVTLDHMALGGIYDQVGGGFHRYSTDADWLVPHFEKMLYTQALLTRAYLEAYLLTGKPLYERVVRQTLDYVLAEMTAPDGGFYSATDADSEGREGTFFTWTPKEIRAALPAADAELALRLFGVSEGGNFEGRNILHLGEPLAAGPADFARAYERIRGGLSAAREARPHPLRDEKVVTAWNGMMITGLARAGGDLGEERYLEAAERAAASLWQHARGDDGRLLRMRVADSSSIAATHNDYAFLTEALVTLYDVGGEQLWLDRAVELADGMLEEFWDEVSGGFYLSASDPEGPLPVRPKSAEDLAIPSGNSVAVRALALLAERTGEPARSIRYREKSAATLAAWSGRIRRYPPAYAYMLLGADELLRGSAGRVAYGAGGRVAVKAAEPTLGRPSGGDGPAGAARPVTLWLEIAPGWHVNAHQPLDETLIATRLAAVDGVALDEASVEYPAAEQLRLGFQDEPVAVYQGRVAIRATVTPLVAGPPPRVARLALEIQACDDRRCLEPEELQLEIPIATGGRRAAS